MEAGKEQITLGDEGILLADDAVRTTDELIETTDDVVEEAIVTPTSAAHTLLAAFGPLLDADYLPGKTRFRDALSEEFVLSELTAEELCDELERARMIRFVSDPTGTSWHIHAEGEEEETREH